MEWATFKQPVHAGYYRHGELRIYLRQRPRWLHRWMMHWAFGWEWKDE